MSLLCVLGKIFKCIIFKHVYNHQLLELCHKFSSALDERMHVCVVSLDISKAFDKVWHKGLLFKLKQCGIQGNILGVISSYLSDRWQCVLINGQFSDWLKILAGVPQGSVLGSLLFLMFINDITTVVTNCNVRLFANDTCLFTTVKDHRESAELINQDLKSIKESAKQWLVTFSPSKTGSMVVSLKPHAQNSHPRLIFYNMPIGHVRAHKHIGLWISHNLKWHQHIESLIDKCSRLIDILKLLKNKLNRKAIEKIFFSYIRPIMEYADIIWAGAPISVLSKLDHIVAEAMRAVTGAPARSNTSNLYKETGWIPLATRREKIHVLKMVFKISNNFCPTYLNNILPGIIREYPMQTVNVRHNIESRAVLTNFPPIRTRTRLLDYMFPALGTKLWNALPAELKNSSSFKSFAAELSKLKCSSITLSKSTHNLYCHGSRRVSDSRRPSVIDRILQQNPEF